MRNPESMADRTKRLYHKLLFHVKSRILKVDFFSSHLHLEHYVENSFCMVCIGTMYMFVNHCNSSVPQNKQSNTIPKISKKIK
jgi:hypothetical protein